MATATSGVADRPVLEPSRARALRRELMAWYARHGRHDLDWRQTRDPYAVLVSEVMLQQTQVERVLPYYRDWIARWPDASSLADAAPADVIRAWGGLGYNRRAVYLQRAASAAVVRFAGRFPPDARALSSLPGIGPYTAAAVACFAYGRSVPVVDTNVGRVVARSLAGRPGYGPQASSQVHDYALALMPASNARAHNLALMDLGALVCRARSPQCDACPLRRDCTWLGAGRPPDPPRRSAASQRFESTSRFGRGQVVRALRDASASMAVDEIASRLPEPHRASVASYLEMLEREGLATRTADGWALPAPGQGSSSIASPKL